MSEARAVTARRLGVLLPLIAFAGLAALFLYRLYAGDPQRLPSALIGRPAPTVSLPALPGLQREGKPLPGIEPALLRGEVTVVNVFASWCAPCREEHPALMALSREPNLRILGLNYKDRNDAALKFLDQLGNPYAAVGVDASGRAGIEWGVYGVPETFILRPDGTISYKYVGPINPNTLRTVILPEIAKARRG
jgi:cytochrome c biogenesis protein CcmG/thiol:disulfide interchange protein DsbE